MPKSRLHPGFAIIWELKLALNPMGHTPTTADPDPDMTELSGAYDDLYQMSHRPSLAKTSQKEMAWGLGTTKALLTHLQEHTRSAEQNATKLREQQQQIVQIQAGLGLPEPWVNEYKIFEYQHSSGEWQSIGGGLDKSIAATGEAKTAWVGHALGGQEDQLYAYSKVCVEDRECFADVPYYMEESIATDMLCTVKCMRATQVCAIAGAKDPRWIEHLKEAMACAYIDDDGGPAMYAGRSMMEAFFVDWLSGLGRVDILPTMYEPQGIIQSMINRLPTTDPIHIKIAASLQAAMDAAHYIHVSEQTHDYFCVLACCHAMQALQCNHKDAMINQLNTAVSFNEDQTRSFLHDSLQKCEGFARDEVTIEALEQMLDLIGSDSERMASTQLKELIVGIRKDEKDYGEARQQPATAPAPAPATSMGASVMSAARSLSATFGSSLWGTNNAQKKQDKSETSSAEHGGGTDSR